MFHKKAWNLIEVISKLVGGQAHPPIAERVKHLRGMDV